MAESPSKYSGKKIKVRPHYGGKPFIYAQFLRVFATIIVRNFIEHDIEKLDSMELETDTASQELPRRIQKGLCLLKMLLRADCTSGNKLMHRLNDT